MRRLGFASLLIALLLCCVAFWTQPQAVYAAAAGFIITDYDVDITVNEDNSYDIIETIDVEFTAQRRGIFRTIPLGSTGPFPARIRNLHIEGAPHEVEREGTQWLVRIGDPNQYAPQFMRYVISYNYYVGDQQLDGYEEFYFNPIGTDWDTSIQNATFTVKMPKPFDESKLNITAGPHGAETNVEYVTYEVRDTTIVGQTVQELMPREGITVALTLPEGYFSKVTARIDWGYYAALVGLIVFPLTALGVFALWRSMRKNNRIVPSVQFYPPSTTTSADVGFILDGVSSSREITSLLIYWAGKGNLTIEEVAKKQLFGSSSSFIFTKVKELDPQTAKPYELILFSRLFALGDGTQVTSKQLENKFHEDIQHAQQGVKAFYTDVPDSRVVAQSNVPFTALAGFLSFLAGLLFFAALSPLVWIYEWGLLVFLGIGAAVSFLFIGAFFLFFKPFTDREHANAGTWVTGIMLGALALLGGMIAFVLAVPSLAKMASVVIGLIALAICGWCLSTPYKRTPLGDEYMGKLLGFREFLRVAEKPRLEMLIDENPSYFYDVLPFALVMGVTDKWADKFKDIEMEAPGWYTSNTGVPFVPILFMSSMNSSLNAINTVATSSPAQSGGSIGGGSVGGGFGGGGGGSW